MDFRPCTIEDLPLLRKLALQTFMDTFAAYNTPENVAHYRAQAMSEEAFRQQLSNPHSAFYLASVKGQVVGYIKLNQAPAQTDLQDTASIELERIYVLKEHHGQGFGKFLMTFALEQAKALGGQYLWLGVWDQNTSAIGFYEKLGFERFGEHDFMFGNERQIDYLYRITL